MDRLRQHVGPRPRGEVRRGGYALILDKEWRTLELRMMIEHVPGIMDALHLMASGDGTWTDAGGRHQRHLDGCIDVDIQWSPLTNALPVRRLVLAAGQQHDISVAYITLPEPGERNVAQRYARIDQRRVRYESPTTDIHRELMLDDEGFVVEYPGLFTRAWPDRSRGA